MVLLFHSLKQAIAYVFDRVTGKPRWDLVDCPVPASSIEGEESAGHQRIPIKPLAFDHQGVYHTAGRDLLNREVEANILNYNPEIEKKTLEVLSNYSHGPLYTPPSELDEDNGHLGTLQVPGFLGGASWAGAVINESTGDLFVSSVTAPYPNVVTDAAEGSPYKKFTALAKSASIRHKVGDSWERYPHPLLKPPWGRITKIDLASGDHSWDSPLVVGRGPRDALEAEYSEGLPKGDLGWNRRTHLLATPTLLFATQEAGRRPTGTTGFTALYSLVEEHESRRTLDVYNQENKKLICKIEIPAHPQGALMSFSYSNKQYLAIPVGGFDKAAQVLIYKLNVD